MKIEREQDRNGTGESEGLQPFEELDRLLTSLGAAQPDAGFSQRMMHAVEARVKAKPERQKDAWAWAKGGGLLATAALLAAVAVSAILRHPNATVLPVKQPREALNGAPKPGVREKVATVSSNESVRHSHARRRTDVPLHAPGISPADDASTGDMQAQVGFPAPPAPLTEQEKLLLKIAHTGDPIELAMLNPEMQEDLQMRERKEVEKFFYKPPVVDPDEKLYGKPKVKGAKS